MAISRDGALYLHWLKFSDKKISFFVHEDLFIQYDLYKSPGFWNIQYSAPEIEEVNKLVLFSPIDSLSLSLVLKRFHYFLEHLDKLKNLKEVYFYLPMVQNEFFSESTQFHKLYLLITQKLSHLKVRFIEFRELDLVTKGTNVCSFDLAENFLSTFPNILLALLKMKVFPLELKQRSSSPQTPFKSLELEGGAKLCLYRPTSPREAFCEDIELIKVAKEIDNKTPPLASSHLLTTFGIPSWFARYHQILCQDLEVHNHSF